MIIGLKLFETLLAEASTSERLRTNLDLRNSSSDTSQRMLNALQPGTEVPIHRHLSTSETVVLLKGRIAEVYYDDYGNETERVELDANGKNRGVQVAAGRWHTVEVYEPSVIIEFKAGSYEPLSEDEILKK